MAKKKTTTARKAAKKKSATKARPKKVAGRRAAAGRKATAKKSTRKQATRKRPASKPKAKQATRRKAAVKKTASKRAPAKKAVTKKAATKKAASKKAVTKKAVTKKAVTKKAVTKKAVTKKAVTKKAVTKKASRATGKVNSTKRANSKAKQVEEVFEEPLEPVKSPYTKTQLRPMRKALLRLRQRILSDLGMLSDEALRASDPDVDTESVADHGSDAYELNLTLGLMEHDSQRIREIDKAMAIMDAGGYGACQLCRKPIPLARLEALPFASTCVSCQEKEERRF